jgi:hypothetical protein
MWFVPFLQRVKLLGVVNQNFSTNSAERSSRDFIVWTQCFLLGRIVVTVVGADHQGIVADEFR